MYVYAVYMYVCMHVCDVFTILDADCMYRKDVHFHVTWRGIKMRYLSMFLHM
jgi:hypothetical protein